MNNNAQQIPMGITALFIAQGRVIAHATDCVASAPGGFTLTEAQEFRAKRQLARNLVKELSSPLLYENLTDYDCEQLMSKPKGSVHYIPLPAIERSNLND